MTLKSRPAIHICGDGTGISTTSAKTAVIEANGVDRFVFSFTGECVVSVDIRRESNETVVELTQSKIPDDKDHGIYVDCSYGWAFYLANLKSVLEGGIDLRNKNVEVKNVVNS